MLSSKSKFIAAESIAHYFRTHNLVWFLTFSEPGRKQGEALWTKDEAEAKFKPFRDYCSRRKIELLVVWEQQKRGSWHPHCLVDGYVDVNWCRPWMVQRGWGQQMRFELLVGTRSGDPSHTKKIIYYLTKYLTKHSVEAAASTKKKLFCGARRCKIGTTAFKWLPTEKAGAYLYAMGRSLFIELYGRLPKFRDMRHVMRLGVEDTGWANIDFLWEFSIPDG